jgi:hypothetical protein
MLLAGFISVLQVTILPGFIFVSIFKIKTDSVIQKWLYVFSFSLFINYILVTVFTLFSIYTMAIMWGLLALEFLTIIFFCRNELSKLSFDFNLRSLYKKYEELIKNNSTADRIIIILSSLIILFYVAVFLANIGTIFYFVDTVNNYEWNRWAIDFANNILPKHSSHFPQLLPANWSICYVMIGKTDVQFFPKSIMPLFFIGNLLMFLDLAFTKKDKAFLMGLIIYGLFAPIIYSLVFIADGNADLPVSFFAFLTFYSLIKILWDEHLDSDEPGLNALPIANFKSKDYYFIFSLACMTAATKMAGFYTFAVIIFILGIFLFIRRHAISKADIAKIIICCIGMGSISIFWYLRSPEVMYSGLNQPQYLSPKGYQVILLNALKLMYYYFGLPVFAFLIITVTASLFNKKVRYISLVMVIVPIIIWMFKYSADFRNLSFVVPFLSFSSAFGLFKLIGYTKTSWLQNAGEKTSPVAGRKKTLKLKERLFLISTIIISSIMLLIFISNKFYIFLLGIYEFINKYYFLSHRIVYFIEYGISLDVDFYQRVFIAFSIILITLPILILTKLRAKVLILIVMLSVIFLNFTVINEKTILNHQKKSIEKVDARNYYGWLKTIIDNNKLDKNVYTNFEAILLDKTPREINFHYLKKVSKESLQKVTKKNCAVFLQSSKLDQVTMDFIKSRINNKEYKSLLDDSDYIFFIINP